MNKLYTVFVYGTLRLGHGNHYLLGEADFLGYATVSPRARLRMIDITNGGFPYVVKASVGQSIVGEVYRVDAFTLEQLDRLEGVPTHYRRERVGVSLDGRRRQVFIYIGQVDDDEYDQDDVVESGDWNVHTSDVFFEEILNYVANLPEESQRQLAEILEETQ